MADKRRKVDEQARSRVASDEHYEVDYFARKQAHAVARNENRSKRRIMRPAHGGRRRPGLPVVERQVGYGRRNANREPAAGWWPAPEDKGQNVT
jgi:hypothetical protein